MKKFIALTTSFIIASAAANADIVQDKINALFASGYTHFEIARGSVKSKIEAYNANGEKIEIIISNDTGDIISQQTETIGVSEGEKHRNTIQNRHDHGDDNDVEGINHGNKEHGMEHKEDDDHGSGRSGDDDHGSSHIEDDNNNGLSHDDDGPNHSSEQDDHGSNHNEINDDNGEDHSTTQDDHGSNHNEINDDGPNDDVEDHVKNDDHGDDDDHNDRDDD